MDGRCRSANHVHDDLGLFNVLWDIRVRVRVFIYFLLHLVGYRHILQTLLSPITNFSIIHGRLLINARRASVLWQCSLFTSLNRWTNRHTNYRHMLLANEFESIALLDGITQTLGAARDAFAIQLRRHGNFHSPLSRRRSQIYRRSYCETAFSCIRGSRLCIT